MKYYCHQTWFGKIQFLRLPFITSALSSIIIYSFNLLTRTLINLYLELSENVVVGDRSRSAL